MAPAESALPHRVRPPDFSRGTLATSICAQLKHEILAGKLLQGDRLNEVSLAERFGVSPTPVREAVRLLVADGLVEYLDRRGVRVISLSEAEIRHAFAVRAALEREALKEAIPLMAQHQRAELLSLAMRTSEARNQPAPVLFEIDRAFHAYFVERAGNQWLTEFSARISNVLTVARLHLFADPDIDTVVEEHVSIARAVIDEDVSAAELALQQHIERVCGNAIRARERGRNANALAGEGAA